MEFGKVAYQGKTSKGKELIIRYPNKDDAQLMREYINTLSEERTFIRFQGEKVSLEEVQDLCRCRLCAGRRGRRNRTRAQAPLRARGGSAGRPAGV